MTLPVTFSTGPSAAPRHGPSDPVAAPAAAHPPAVRIAGARLAAKPHWSLRRFVERLRAAERRLDELSHGQLSVRTSLEQLVDARLLDIAGVDARGRMRYRFPDLVRIYAQEQAGVSDRAPAAA
jgi:hypothetical protein